MFLSAGLLRQDLGVLPLGNIPLVRTKFMVLIFHVYSSPSDSTPLFSSPISACSSFLVVPVKSSFWIYILMNKP